MATRPKSEPVDVSKVKAALVSAGVLKSTTLSKADQTKIEQELSRNHVDRLKLSFQIICHSAHYCIIVKGIN
jgi:hypothetical protein